MALLLCKASSSPVVRLATRRPPGFSSSYLSLFSPGRVPFSSSSETSDISHTISDNNIGEKFDNEMACYSNDLPIPRDFPFYLNAFSASKYVYMLRRYEKEIITAVIDRDNPSPLIDVAINTMNAEVLCTMSAKLNQLHICEVTVRDKDCGMADYVQYLRTKGITHETILYFYGLMGFKM